MTSLMPPTREAPAITLLGRITTPIALDMQELLLPSRLYGGAIDVEPWWQLDRCRRRMTDRGFIGRITMTAAGECSHSHTAVQFQRRVVLKIPALLFPDRSAEFRLVVFSEERRLYARCVVCRRNCWIVVIFVWQRNANWICRLNLVCRKNQVKIFLQAFIPVYVSCAYSGPLWKTRGPRLDSDLLRENGGRAALRLAGRL